MKYGKYDVKSVITHPIKVTLLQKADLRTIYIFIFVSSVLLINLMTG